MRQRIVDHELMIGDLTCTELARRFDTPVYATDERVVRENYRRVRDAFDRYLPTGVHYACKANSGLAILRYSSRRGHRSTP